MCCAWSKDSIKASRTNDANFNSVFVENALVFIVQKNLGDKTPRTTLSDPPDMYSRWGDSFHLTFPHFNYDHRAASSLPWYEIRLYLFILLWATHLEEPRSGISKSQWAYSNTTWEKWPWAIISFGHPHGIISTQRQSRGHDIKYPH